VTDVLQTSEEVMQSIVDQTVDGLIAAAARGGTQRLHPYVIQPEGAERLRLLAERNMIAEGLRDAHNQRANCELLCVRLEQKLAVANAKLRGEP
jgi:hypothetical protein